MKKTTIALLITVLFSISGLVAADSGFTKNLYFGLQNDNDVIKLQEFLAGEINYSGPITGNFFSLTLQAVKDFQTKYEITPVAGYFGILTRTKANEILAGQLKASDQEQIKELGAVAITTASKTTDDVVAAVQSQITALLEQVSLLQQQLTAQQQTVQSVQDLQTQVSQQTQIIQQQQQTLNQIQANTTPTPVSTSTLPAEVIVKPIPIPKVLFLAFPSQIKNDNPSYRFRTDLPQNIKVGDTIEIMVVAKQGDNYINTSGYFSAINVITPDTTQNKTGNMFGLQKGSAVNHLMINDNEIGGASLGRYHYTPKESGTNTITFYNSEFDLTTSVDLIVE